MERANEFILTSLLNSLWMLPVIWASAALGALLLRNVAANQHYILWLGTLALCIVAPLLSSVQLPVEFSTKASQTFAATTQPNAIDENTSPLNRTQKRDWHIVRTSASTVQPFLVLYTIFFLLAIVRFARLWRGKKLLLKSSVPLPMTAPVEAIVYQCRNEFRVRPVQIVCSSAARVPYTLGFLKPLIVLPEKFCTQASNEILLSVVAHEMAHVSRRDYLIKLLVEFMSLPISFHPLTFVIKRQIERERELACDELVTKKFLSPEIYARSLLSAAGLTLLPVPETVALSIFDGRILEKRIMRLKRKQPRMNHRAGRLFTCAAMIGLSASAVSLSVFGIELRSNVVPELVPTEFSKVISTLPPAIATNKTTPQPVERKPNSTAADPNERAQIACTAERKRDTEAIPTLIAMLGDDAKTPLLRCWEGSAWSPALDTFKSPAPGEQAALALASMGRPAFQPLADQLDNASEVVRRNAAWAIGELTNMSSGERRSATPQLINLLSDRDVWVRMAAARAIGELGDRQATPTLVVALTDSDWRMRQMTTWALSELKDDEAVKALCTILLTDARVEVRRGAAEALGEIASAEALASLKQALNDPEPSVSTKASWAIEEIEG
jgi:beta-lactamase regulating signal transducer with metallopeptidase domain